MQYARGQGLGDMPKPEGLDALDVLGDLVDSLGDCGDLVDSRASCSRKSDQSSARDSFRLVLSG